MSNDSAYELHFDGRWQLSEPKLKDVTFKILQMNPRELKRGTKIVCTSNYRTEPFALVVREIIKIEV